MSEDQSALQDSLSLVEKALQCVFSVTRGLEASLGDRRLRASVKMALKTKSMDRLLQRLA
jgi:hypothetical protein